MLSQRRAGGPTWNTVTPLLVLVVVSGGGTPWLWPSRALGGACVEGLPHVLHGKHTQLPFVRYYKEKQPLSNHSAKHWSASHVIWSALANGTETHREIDCQTMLPSGAELRACSGRRLTWRARISARVRHDDRLVLAFVVQNHGFAVTVGEARGPILLTHGAAVAGRVCDGPTHIDLV